MPLLETSAALASVVGLIGQFVSGRDAAKSHDFNSFMQWLAESNHSELKALIESNHTTNIGVKAILSKNMESLRDSLERIDAALAAFTSAIDGFAQLGEGLRPNRGLSEQALSILRQLEAAQASAFLVFPAGQSEPGEETMVFDGSVESLEIPEARFLSSDLGSLVSVGALIAGRNSQGTPMYTVTRVGAELVKSNS